MRSFSKYTALTVLWLAMSSILAHPIFSIPAGQGSARVAGRVKRATLANQSKAQVTIKDVGPELGTNRGLEGFLINPQNPLHLLALTVRAGVFKSTDGGMSWFPSNKGLTLPYEEALNFALFTVRKDPGSPSGVYAVGEWGLYHSTDFGDTWALNESLLFYQLIDCAVNPTTPNIVFALGSGFIVESTDGGATFGPHFSTGLPEFGGFTNIVFAPADPNIVYVAANEGFFGSTNGVYKSTDGGASFARLDDSPPSPLQVFPHPTQANTLFVEAAFGSTLLYRSTDGGASFNEVTAGLPAGRENYFVAFDPANPSRVYVAGEGGLFRSADGGATFAASGLRQDQVGLQAITLSIDPTNTDVIYVNTSKGNFKSVNGGTSFFAINRGWQASMVRGLTFDNHAQPSLYVATSFNLGILRTQSRGDRYHAIGEYLFGGVASPRDATVSSVAVAATDRNFMVATTAYHGIFRSTDAGLSWAAATVDTGQAVFFFAKVVIDPKNPTNVYVACPFEPFPGFYRSTDGGHTFFRAEAGWILALAVDPNDPQVIYVGFSGTGQPPLKSTDGGLSFTPLMTDPFQGFVNEIAINPQNSEEVYITGQFFLSPDFVTQSYLLRSTDGGASFTRADTGLPGPARLIAVDPVNSSKLFVSASGFVFGTPFGTPDLFMSEDGGESWSLVDTGGETFRRGGFEVIAINPKKPNLLYLGGASVLEIEIKP